MRKTIYYFIFLLFFVGVFSEEAEEADLPLVSSEQIASFLSDDTYLIGGLVSPVSGNVVLKNRDLVSRGAEEVNLTRYYLSPSMPSFFHEKADQNRLLEKRYLTGNYQGWTYFPHRRLQVKRQGGGAFLITLVEPHGATLEFFLKNGRTKLHTKSYGISNLSCDAPSGKNDIRNIRIEILDEGSSFMASFPDGVKRYYRSQTAKKLIKYFCFLDKEILPSGKVLKYRYDKSNLFSVEAMDMGERYVYSSIKIEGYPSNNKGCFFTNGSGQRAIYNYELRPYDIKVKYNKHKSEHDIGAYPPILTYVNSPLYQGSTICHNDHLLLTEVNDKDMHFKCSYGKFGKKPSYYRVNQLSLPVGNNDTFVGVYNISYDPPIAGKKGGSTSVSKADGTLTVYNFSKNLLMDSIKYFDQNKILKKQKLYSWLENGWLKSLEVKDGNGSLLFKRSYEYDRYGNPIVETFSGNLTGLEDAGQKTGQPIEETYTIKREYSQDGENLLLKEEKDSGLITTYEYVPNTHLARVKLVKEKEQILMREFYEYDDSYNLIAKIVDDGSFSDINDLQGVSERKITRYAFRQQAPFLHMIECIEERYLEGGGEKLLSRRYLSYDKDGNIAQEDIYDSPGNFVYSIYKEYNERGDLLSETNPSGQKAIYAYDSKGRCTQSTDFSKRIEKEMAYDAKGRLKVLEEKAIDGVTHRSAWEYDVNDSPVKKNDYFENPIFYEYDPLVNKAVSRKFPSVLSPEGEIQPVATTGEYNSLGFETLFTDANGNQTLYEYNAYGSPVKITYADGSFEIFSYFKDGKLSSYTNPEGLKIEYKYDVLGRTVLKTYIYKDEEIAINSFRYNGFHLIEETDKEGFVTKYIYDGAGRVKSKDFEGRAEEYFYDGLGRVSKLNKYNGENTLCIIFERDLLDRVVKESRTDLHGNLLFEESYSYDDAGNRSSIIKNIDGKESKDIFFYDPFNRLVQHTDALGNITQIIYDEKYVNSLGQRALKKITIDPKKTSKVEVFDSEGRVAEKATLNPQGLPIALEKMFYDSQGNLTHHFNHIYEGPDYKKKVCIKYDYDNRNRKSSMTRAYGSNDSKATYYDYTFSGMLKNKTLPDGIILSYSYDPLGCLSSLTSSDEQIDQHFRHNKEGYLIEADDFKQEAFIKRNVDPFGNILKEDFSTGLSIEKTFDLFGRPLQVKLSNSGSINYTYDPLYLRNIERSGVDERGNYTHHYDKYDLTGLLLSESMPEEMGEIFHRRDLKGRKISIKSPFLDQKCGYDECDNITELCSNGKSVAYQYDDLSQITGEKGLIDTQYEYDSNYNRIKKDEALAVVNDLDEIISLGNIQCSYDENGNLVSKVSIERSDYFKHDPLNRLIEVQTPKYRVSFTYDALGRRMTKTVFDKGVLSEKYSESYLYEKNEEIGSFGKDGKSKQLKILGNGHNCIAIEVDGKVFASIVDIQGNICGLIDSKKSSQAEGYDFNVFGEKTDLETVASLNPWQYKQKRLDPETRLVYFGKRYYDPELGRWLTTDPVGFVDSVNLYQYVFNNPLTYTDFDGQFAFAIPILIWGAGLVWPSLSAIVVPLVYGAITGAVVYGGYKVVEALNDNGYVANAHYAGQSVVNHYRASQEALKEERNEQANEEKKKSASPGKIQGEIEKGKAPESAVRADKGRGFYEKDHIHFDDGSALNIDGSWKHGGRELSRKEVEWLENNGWNVP